MYVWLWMIGWWRMMVVKEIMVAGRIFFDLVVVYWMCFPFTKLWTYEIIVSLLTQNKDFSFINEFIALILLIHRIRFIIYLFWKLDHHVPLCRLQILIPQRHKIKLKDGVKCNVCKCPPMNPDCFLAKQLYMLYYSAYWNVENTWQ